MLHIISIIEFKTGFRLNKSYDLDINAEMMNWAEIFSPIMELAVCFAWHPWVVFVVRSGNPCGAKQRQPGKEVEERHQAQYRTKGGARRRLNQRG